MKLTEALHYAKEIIKNGKKKGYSATEVKHSIITYTDIVKDEGNITEDDAKVLMAVANKTSDIMSGETTVDKVSICYLSEQRKEASKKERPYQKVKSREEESSPIVVDCHSSVKRDRCGNIVTDRCGGPVYESSSSSSRCGSSSSSFGSCGSSSGGFSHC
ncbi:MAG: hypothetical protein IKF47_02895 [Bacilli bacterium]|nr:hypothetical protein [Bacilli bacterium]